MTSSTFAEYAGELTDALLSQRASNGDQAAFQALVRKHAPAMRAYAIRLTGTTADADDVLQETFIQAWKKLDTLEDHSKVRSWLMTLTSRKAIDLIRTRKSNVSIDSVAESHAKEQTPEQSAITGSQINALAHALETLPEQSREIWIMREIGGSSYQEIAELLGISPASVRGKLARARVKLVQEMEEWK
ncbi:MULTISPECIES: RNA polymerase sigma factor [unclassified Rothia (in: high G+C Gram-positive bacteria)]|uniref:RNA polymerase sigma factor n=1 Tax=unclassified Rothia (in: high G+C Gram-positive bacteria) TaxID=2689056 RepID=UPI00195E66BE|nr:MULTISPECIES: RNA polymerase sigma factor [unclassified Rothia (in: high G+C Gram-positive bacteria)]MBM7051724.1 RNA polymerase sigma factor [Rothia sp. ZJ1223]QRZ61655.1 RNA polymerase sigma factor [Rothia sp. ZJ932]